MTALADIRQIVNMASLGCRIRFLYMRLLQLASTLALLTWEAYV